MSGNKNNTSFSPAYMEQTLRDALDGKEEIQRHDKRCHIHIHSIRKRLTDPDGVSSKAAIDGLVVAGILKDDSSEFIKEISKTQEKGENETVITITWE